MEIKKIILGLSVLISMQLNAQIITDRPDQTESSSTVGNGNLQIETGFLIGFEGDNQSSNRQILAPTNLFRYGVSKSIEVRFLSQYESLRNDNVSVEGISDIEIGTKVQLLKDESKNTEIAFLSHIIVPTGTKELTNDNLGTINKISISHEINERVGIGYNLGYNYFGQGKGDLTYSLALGIGINNRVGIYIEPYGELIDLEEYIPNFDAGLTYLANKNLQFDFSFGTGINKRMNYISIGFSLLINKNKN
ncbi:transporter [Aquimarina megaterium]|uniref:transporter n=1 Tax=Aquimarina megaterium TaxID=1443666 RepID=UPI000472921A|nr:transporter [Aquimarina megaterium]